METLIRSIIEASLAHDWVSYAALKKAFFEAQQASNDGGQALAEKAQKEAKASGLATF